MSYIPELLVDTEMWIAKIKGGKIIIDTDLFTQKAGEAVYIGAEEALKTNHGETHPGHILCGLVQIGDPSIIKYLTDEDSALKAFTRLRAAHSRGGKGVLGLSFPEDTKEGIRRGTIRGLDSGSAYLETEGLLFGMLSAEKPNGHAHELLRSLGVNPDHILQELTNNPPAHKFR